MAPGRDRLQALADKWSPALDAVGDMVCLLAPDGTILCGNRAMAELVDRQPGQLADCTCCELLHDSAGFIPGCPFAAMLHSGRRETLELALRDRWLQVTADPVFLDGEIAGGLHIARDVTGYRNTIDGAAERSRRLEAITTLAVDLAALPRRTDPGRFLAGRLLELTGAVGVAYSEYDPVKRLLQTRVVELKTGALRKLTRPLLRRLQGTESPVDDAMYAEIMEDKDNVRATLTETSGGAIPPAVDLAVRRLLDVDRFLGISYIVEGRLYGTSLLALRTGSPAPPVDLLEAFKHLAAVSLRRRAAELEAERAAQQVLELNADLESRVKERTLQLAAANRSMQEFVYSAAHDLRTPLRAIDGFSLAVLEQHGETIGEDGSSDLERVRSAAQTMGRLIDALQTLARISRQEVHAEAVDLTTICLGIVADLREADPGRRVDVTIPRGLVAETDPALAAIVLRSLLDNAWKFTSGREVAHITVGTLMQGDTRVFSVEDDGVGFDPAYADKLFSPFQRLHAPDRFPGTGIGLATAKRALERLGGEWWAEGTPGTGATFYFSLSHTEEKL